MVGKGRPLGTKFKVVLCPFLSFLLSLFSSIYLSPSLFIVIICFSISCCIFSQSHLVPSLSPTLSLCCSAFGQGQTVLEGNCRLL